MLLMAGFSRQITQILDEQGVKYSTFDILEDDDVRQGNYEQILSVAKIVSRGDGSSIVAHI